LNIGIKIPQELPIAGSNDQLISNHGIIPSLTTIQRPVGAMASLAAYKIIQSIEKHTVEVLKSDFLVKPHLIIRESTSTFVSKHK